MTRSHMASGALPKQGVCADAVLDLQLCSLACHSAGSKEYERLLKLWQITTYLCEERLTGTITYPQAHERTSVTCGAKTRVLHN